MGLFEGADPLRAACRVFDAEQFLLHALRRHGGGAQDDEGTIGPLRQGMERAGGEFLAGAHVAGDQHAAVGRRDLLERLAQLAHRRGVAEQFGIGSGATLQFLVLALEPRGFERPADDQDQPVGLERLLDIVIGAALDGRDGGFDIAVARDDDDRQFGMLLLDDVEEIEPVELRSLQPDVEDRSATGGGRRSTASAASLLCASRVS